MSVASDHLQTLFSEGSIGRLRLRNRLIQAPMHTLFASNFGEVTDRLIAYHATRARGGVGMIILENTAVNWQVGRAAGNPVRIDDNRFIAGLHDLVEAVHREGALMATQLHHAGRQNMGSNIEGGGPPVAPSPIQSKVGGDPPRELTIPEIKDIVQEFAEGARRTVAAGFDAVEIHGSHGYLLTQFLSPATNQRTDEYGGSFENRCRMPLEVVRAVREAVGDDFPVMYRISLEERTENGMGAEEGVEFCSLIEPYVDAIDVTAGIYESMEWIFTMQGVNPGSLLGLAKAVKERVNVPVIGISRLGWALDDAAQAIEAGELDFVSMARTQLTDPELVNKTRKGQHRRVRRCIACNECVGGFLFQGWRTQCVINPELGNESRLSELMHPVGQRKRVLIVGGGPSGCEAARVAARRGHEVSLIEYAHRLGGQLRAASAPEFKRREMEALIDFYEVELEHLGVRVDLNTEATEELLADGYDLVLLATGMVAPNPPGSAIDAIDVLTTRELPDGDLITVVGSGEVALNTAAFCAEQGRKTRIWAQAAEIGTDMNPLLAGHTQEYLRNRGVEIHTETDEIPDEGITLWAPAYVPSSDFQDVVDGERIVGVGTRVRPGRLYEATQSAFWTASRI